MKEKETLVYKGKIFDLIQKDVLINDKIYQRDIIRHPGGVGVLVTADEKILLVKQFRHAIDKETLEIPAGKLEYGEDPKTCGMRELNEEAYLECDDLHLITSIVSTPGFCDERIWIYEAVNTKAATHHLAQDEDENIDLVWLDIKDAYQMFLDQKIDDAKTVIAIQYAYINRK